MIRVGITGGETRTGAELLRLLVQHPEVTIENVYAPAYAGVPISAVHHGFIGEQPLQFSSNRDFSNLDFLFVLVPMPDGYDVQSLISDNAGIKTIILSNVSGIVAAAPVTGDSGNTELSPVTGLSEIYRKALVRGARVAVLPNPVASLALVALYPLARHLMLPAEMQIKVTAPADIMEGPELGTATNQMKTTLSAVQHSFPGDIAMEATILENDERGMMLETNVPGQTSVEELFRIYDEVYDDHNFAFVTGADVSVEEVEGTQRCIISLSKPEGDSIRIRAVADCRMRGGAGEAVHIMNLMGGLYEKTGLMLKACRY